jgi:hypothetical protein
LSFKGIVKLVLRPVTRRMDARTNSMIDQGTDLKVHPLSDGLRLEINEIVDRLNVLEAGATDRMAMSNRVDEMAVDVGALTRHLPKVMNTIASQNALRRDQQRRIEALQQHTEALSSLPEGLAYLTDRLEFVRKEMLLEQRYRVDSTEQRAAQGPVVLDEQKLRAMGDDLRLNIGAGHILMPGYLNTDSRELPGIDIVAEAHDLPFGVGELSEIYSSHLLEHFPLEDLRRKLLPYWVTLLKDGGRFVAVVPDTEMMVAELAAGRMSFDDFREVVYGGQEYEGDFHFNGFSPASLAAILTDVGLVDVTVRESGRRNGLCYEMEIEGTRASDPND